MSSSRDRIIVSTNELFRRRGYNGTSLKQISEASGSTIGSIYHFFPGGKEALGVAVVQSTGESYRELFELIISDAQDLACAFSDFFNAAAVVLEESDFIDPCPIGGIAREVANTSEALRLAAEAVFDSWILTAQTHLQNAGLDDREAEELAYLFVSSVEGSFVLSRTQRSTRLLAVMGQHVGSLVQRSIDEALQGAD